MNRLLLWLNWSLLIGSIALWIMAAVFGWLESVAFVSHISLAALVFSALAGIPAAKAACEAQVVESDDET